MVDRETNTFWSQVTGRAIDGQHRGAQLEKLEAVETSWEEWSKAHPETKLLKKSEEVLGSHYQSYFDDHERPLETLIDVQLDERSDPLWQRRTASIARYSLSLVTMCIETEIDGDITNPESLVMWANPQILSAADRDRRADRTQRISDQERRLRGQQLRTLGYVD